MVTLAPVAPTVAQARVGAVVRAPAREALIERAIAAYEGGLRVLVLPVTIPFVAEIAAEIADRADDVTVGLTDVTDAEHLSIAMAAGASFAMLTGLDEELEKSAQGRGITVVPAIATPSELLTARRRQHGLIAAYPVGYLGGARYFGRLARIHGGPLAAVGHIGPDDAPAYLEAGANVVIVDHGLFPADADPASAEVISLRAGALVEVCGEIVPRPSRP
jgi:2-dehydro-3-deoxyphosphogluconate aldolase / (4S)-4-hydroxy-2-oxoglutarate aldolase